jgi:RimJ/RimL family protein N-acetyltransferase
MIVSPADLTALARTPYRITTDRLVLRCFRPEDAPLRKRALDANFDVLGAFLRLTSVPSLDEHAVMVRRFRSQLDVGGDGIYAVLSADESRLLGECFLLTRAGIDAREIGYAFYERGQGYATEASRALLITAFRALDLKRMDLQYRVGNAESARVAEKLGFVKEGVLRGRTIGANPTPYDVQMTSLLRAEAEPLMASWPLPKAFDFLGREIGDFGTPR